MHNNTRTVILASSSSIRADLLRSAGILFEVHASEFDEAAYRPTIALLPIPEQTIELAKQKALWVSKLFPESVVIGADQICELDGKIFSKPYDRETAFLQLDALSGKTHCQHSGVCIAKDSQIIWNHCETAHLEMKVLSSKEQEAYIALDLPYKSCGSYRFESHGHQLFKTVKGDRSTILGLPLTELLHALHDKGYVSKN